jgi:hypothetical protein
MKVFISGFFGNDNFLSQNFDFIRFERSRRRTGDDISAQIEPAVMAGAENCLCIAFVEDSAGKMGTNSGESRKFSFFGVDENSRRRTKFKDFIRIGSQFAGFCG